MGESVRVARKQRSRVQKLPQTTTLNVPQNQSELVQQAIQHPTPQTLTPQTMQLLQRTHGNQFVMRLVSRANAAPTVSPMSHSLIIQRLTKRSALEKRLKGSKSGFTTILDSLDTYNALDDKATPQQRFQALNDLDRAIYGWFKDQTSQDLSKLPNAGALKDLLKETEQEHADLVDSIKGQANTELPIDIRGISGTDQAKLKLLWASIVGGTGNISMEGNAAFKKATLAKLAKIMQTDTGQKLLDYLNNSQDATRDERIMIFEDVKKLPAQFKDIEKDRDSESSYAFPIPAAADQTYGGMRLGEGGAIKGNEVNYGAVSNPKELTEAVLSGKSGITMGGKAYQFGAGSGALVKIHNDQSGAPSTEDKRMIGEHNEEILKPSFVTMAHELGHAAKIRGGALLQGHTGKDELYAGLGEGDTNEQKLWDNPEEFVNIMHIENAIREESNISKRKYHKPISAVNAARRKVELDSVWGRITAKDVIIGGTNEFKTVYDAFNLAVKNVKDDPPNSLAVDSVYNKIKSDFLKFEAKATNKWIIKKKMEYLKPKIKEFETGVKSEATTKSAKWAKTKAFKTELKVAVNAITALSQIGQDYRDWRNEATAQKKRLLDWIDNQLAGESK